MCDYYVDYYVDYVEIFSAKDFEVHVYEESSKSSQRMSINETNCIGLFVLFFVLVSESSLLPF